MAHRDSLRVLFGHIEACGGAGRVLFIWALRPYGLGFLGFGGVERLARLPEFRVCCLYERP